MKTTAHNQDGAKICFSYIRFSSKIQAKGDSERRQLEIAPRVAQEKGWILRHDLCAQSLGVSAWKGDNIKTIESIIDAATGGRIPQGSVMIVEALDRLSRAELDRAYDLFRDLLRAGIEIFVDKGSRHYTHASLKNPIDLLIAIVELAAANEYSTRISDRTGKAWKRKKARAADGVKLGRMTPRWITLNETGEFSPNEHAQTVRRIFNEYANGKGIRTIMRELNDPETGAPPFGKGNQNKGNGWSSTHLRRLLSFRGVLGEYQPCRYEKQKRIPEGEPISDYYPRVIEPSLFYRVQEILSSGSYTDPSGVQVPRHGHASGPRKNVTNLFTGLVKCAKCGSSMVVKRSPCQGGKYNYVLLVCNDALRGHGCGYASIRYEYVERAVLTVLWSKVLPLISEADTRQDEIVRLRGELKDTQAKIKIWTDAIDSGETKPAAAMAKLALYETRQAALERQIERVAATIDGNPLTSWQQVSKSKENRLRLASILRGEIESLTINAATRTALLTTKAPQCQFEIRWENPLGANQVRENPAAKGFLLSEGDTLENEPFLYLDEVFVWKTDKNLPIPSSLEALQTE